MLTKTIEITLPKLHYAQLEIKRAAARFNAIACGRRFGKNVLAVDFAVETLLLGGQVGWFEPTYKTLSEVWREIKNTLAPIAISKHEQEHRIELMTGGVLEMWSLDNPDSARGRKYKRAIINEAAMVGDLGDIWHMIIRPMLADMEGDGFLFSTPKGHNFFWTAYQFGRDSENTDWHAFRYPTSANPYIVDSEIEAMRRTMPERIFRQEIEAEFLDDAGGVFRRVMEAATVKPVLEPEQGGQYIAGVDVATLADYTVVSVMDVAKKSLVYKDRFNRIDYSVLEDRLEAIYKRYNMTAMTIEINGIGQSVVENLLARNMTIVPFTTTSVTKHAIISQLAAAFEHGELTIINDPDVIGELQAFEGKRNQSGGWTYSAPEGMHDDCVMSLAIAWNGFQGWWTT